MRSCFGRVRLVVTHPKQPNQPAPEEHVSKTGRHGASSVCSEFALKEQRQEQLRILHFVQDDKPCLGRGGFLVSNFSKTREALRQAQGRLWATRFGAGEKRHGQEWTILPLASLAKSVRLRSVRGQRKARRSLAAQSDTGAIRCCQLKRALCLLANRKGF